MKKKKQNSDMVIEVFNNIIPLCCSVNMGVNGTDKAQASKQVSNAGNNMIGYIKNKFKVFR